MKLNSTEIRSFFYGTLLGDSYIHNNVFYCKQISKDLIDFKSKIIQQYIPDADVKVIEYEAYTDKNGVHHQKYWVLSAKGEYIKKLQRLFYPQGKKIIPKNVINKLTPLGLAMWYADDGTTILVGKNNTTKSAKSRRVQICTDCFTENEIENAIKELDEIGIKASSLQRREGVYRLQILEKERQYFLCSISDFFYNYFPSLLYKMDLGYRNESLLNRRYVTKEYHKLYTKISACPDFLDRMKNR